MPIWVNRQGRWKMQYNGRMKTKPLTFLLILTSSKTHLRNIYSKTDIHDRANLAIRVLNSDKT